MKLSFEDKSYIEITKSDAPDKIFVTIAAKSAEDSRKLIANCVELTAEQLITLIKSAS